MTKKLVKKAFGVLVILLVLVSVFSVLSFASEAENDFEQNLFVGQSSNISREELNAQTNALRDENGMMTNYIDSSAPQVTFFIPGFGCDASTWSNNYENEESGSIELAYNEKSLIEKIRDKSNAIVYYAKVQAEYEPDNLDGEEPTEGILKSLGFELYEFPDKCTNIACNKTCGKFHDNLETLSSLAVSPITELPINTFSHIIVLFSPAKSNSSNDRIYEQFDYVADKIVFDIKAMHGGLLPMVNLVGHSRGGITAMQYALEHPFLVDSMITMGTPFTGSFLGSFPNILKTLGMSDKPEDEGMFSFGVKDILDTHKQGVYMTTWNNGYDEKYSNINFHAIAGETTVDTLGWILQNDKYQTAIGSNYYGTLIAIADILSNVQYDPATESIYVEDTEHMIYGDCFIHAGSQLAFGYTGVQNHRRIFRKNDIDIKMLAVKNTELPHNLEPGDAQIHDYILSKLRFSNGAQAFTYHKRSDNCIVITGLSRGQQSPSIVIPETIDGMFVREIGPFAFAYEDIEQVIISDYVTKISKYAFYGCTKLNSVTSDIGLGIEVIEEYAFAGCTNLSTFDLPNCTREIGDFAFSGTALSTIHLGTILEFISSSAFSGSGLQYFTISDYNLLFGIVDGVLYNADTTKIIAYPSGKAATSFTVPNTVTEIAPFSFSGAKNLISVNLGNITYVPHGAFTGCENLENVVGASVLQVESNSFFKSKFMEGELVTVGEALLQYKGNEIDTFDVYSVAPYAFANNQSITAVKFSQKLIKIGEFAFLGCSALTEVYLKGNEIVNLEGLAFDINQNHNRSIYVADILFYDYQTNESWGNYKEEIEVFSTSIQYESNGGSSIPETTFSYYSQLTQEKLPVPTRIGYAFVGWVYGEGDNQETLSVGDWWLSLDEEVTLTASWIPSVYSSEFDPCGGTLSSSEIVHTENGVQLPVPTRNGYIFDGWYSEEGGAGTQFTEDDGILLLEWDQIQVPKLYAEWIPISYTITYVLNGGTNASANPTTYTIEDSITFAAPTRSGYRFAGWYTDSAFSIGATTIQNTQGNITLYAKWQFLYTVTFEHNYSTITVQAISGEIVTVPSFSSTDAPVYIYVSGTTRLVGGASYEVKGNTSFKSEERLLSECYQIINGEGVYCIYTYNQFRGIEDITKNSSNKFMLMRDIDVSVTYSIHISDFYGEFDGNGRLLRYVREVVFSADSAGGNYALFKRNYGTIKNFIIDGLQIDIKTASNTSAQNMYYAAFVVGTNYGTISDVSVRNCEIIVNRQCVSVGTIAGYNYNGTISYCDASNITFTGYGDMGGIAGTSADGLISNCTVTSITMTLSIDTVNRSAGGIVAYAYNGAIIKNCAANSVHLYFGSYKNIADTAVQPVMGFVVAYLQDSTLAYSTRNSSCSINYGNLPEQTGNIFNRHYPQKYICASDNGMIGYKSNSAIF